MPLILHRAARADLLALGLADLLKNPLPDPFADELVLVPARGVERWLSQRLSHHLGTGGHADGVCAGVEFRSPRTLVAEIAGTADDDPWAPDRLVWPLLSVIDEHAGEPWCSTLDLHLGHGDDSVEGELRRGRRYAVAHRLAELFASYAVQRPALLDGWLGGEDTDGTGSPIAPDLRWQPELWRLLTRAVDAPTPSQRHTDVIAALRKEGTATDLPERLSLFGHTRIPVTEAELLQALGAHREVHVWLPHPSDLLWSALTDLDGAVVRSVDPSHERAEHPLLASLGRDVRELQRTLGAVADRDEVEGVALERPATLLGWLQHDIGANAAADLTDRELDPGDQSVQVHACHGPARQVEVLREAVLGLLADDPTLEPRDILVMCPDIESYAPLVEAAFGLGGLAEGFGHVGWHPGHRLQVRLADRALTHANPLLGVAGTLLELAGGRAEASRVLDLCATAPVRRRFGFSDDDLETLTTWVEQAGVRWAFDASHREPFGLEGFVHYTWQFGLDRMLAGVAVSDDAQRWFGPTLPLDDVGSTSIDLAGRLAELVDRLRDVTDRLTGTHPVEHWLEALRDGVAALTAVAWGDEWQMGQVQRELAGFADNADGRTDLRLPDVRALMSERLAGRPSRANFRSGSLTVCTMVPMRSVPHRVVCLLGLDDGVFPRSTIVDGDDVLARTPVTGERDPRSEDRQLLLDAVMAATEHLVITYAGANETTGQPRPPAVPLGELLDALDVTSPGGRAHATRHHPLQPFDQRNLVADDLQPGRPFSFDASALAGALAARADRHARVGFADATLPPAPPGDVELAELMAFFRHPVREFLRRRVGITLPDDGEAVSDAMPVEIDGLVEWAVGERLLRDRLRGRDARQALESEWRRGSLPPGRFGWRRAQLVSDRVGPIAAKALAVMGEEPVTSLDVDIDLGDDRRLRGTVARVFGDRVVTWTYSRLGPRHRLDAWLSLLALSAMWPDREWTAGAVGRDGDGTTSLYIPSVEDARDLLRALVRIYDAGMREPLPLPLKTAHAWASFSSERASLKAAAQAWSGARFGPENADPHHVRVWGPAASLDVLLAAQPGPGETVDGETSRLGALARAVWQPINDRVVTS